MVNLSSTLIAATVAFCATSAIAAPHSESRLRARDVELEARSSKSAGKFAGKAVVEAVSDQAVSQVTGRDFEGLPELVARGRLPLGLGRAGRGTRFVSKIPVFLGRQGGMRGAGRGAKFAGKASEPAAPPEAAPPVESRDIEDLSELVVRDRFGGMRPGPAGTYRGSRFANKVPVFRGMRGMRGAGRGAKFASTASETVAPPVEGRDVEDLVDRDVEDELFERDLDDYYFDLD